MLEDIRADKMVIDGDGDGENEGDPTIAAELVTADDINLENFLFSLNLREHGLAVAG